jgi:sRNA-binding carbon storage regulator CsrA
MLALALNEGDYVTIGDDIRIFLNHKTATKGSISIGVQAPKDQVILRSTLYAEHLAELAKSGDEQAKERYVEVKKAHSKFRREKIGISGKRSDEERQLIAKVHLMATQKRAAAKMSEVS